MTLYGRFIKATGFIIFMSALVSCMSKLATRSYIPTAPTSYIVNVPSLETETVIDVGQSMCSTAKKLEFHAIELQKEIIHKGINLGYTFTYTIPIGTLVQRGSDANGTFFQAEQKLRVQFDSDFGFVTGGVYIPTDDSKPPEIYWIATDIGAPLNDPHPGIQYELTMYDEWGKGSFKRELVYTGISQNTISVLYREYMDDMARPAFSQELKYDLSQGDIIGFKGSRFQVFKANNTSIKYKVIKHLD